MKVTFLGAAGTVTGSKYLVEAGSGRFLIDCGLFQGVKALRRRNWARLPIDPATLDAVVLTHAHLDHTGYLPVLVRNGFRGPIYCNPPTLDLVKILLADSAKVQEEEARFANKEGYSRHHPAVPLYGTEEVAAVEPQLRAVGVADPLQVGGCAVHRSIAGHILGATSVRVVGDGVSVMFSGDLGRFHDPLIPAPDHVGAADWVIMESTYGDETHAGVDPVEAIALVLRRTIDRRGVLLIPSFAVGRAQHLLFALDEVFRRGLVEPVPVYVDSPMATDVTDLYLRYPSYHRLTPEACQRVCSRAKFTADVEESKRINGQRGPFVVIASSGMLTGGRVLHHLKRIAPEAENTILLPGYQAPGTRGAALVHGRESVKVHGRYVPIRAEVVQLGMFSAHADQHELLEWLGHAPRPPSQVMLVHGEPEAADVLRVRIEEFLRFPTRAAIDGETVVCS
ncbi:MAG: MBL fold metallo-hydrolase RNA specificity domain-containing protein [Planctomycetota bacterium]